jgi:nucleoside-diphosphate-sugar epimerase
MKILVLGATGGTGRLIVSDAVAKGHSIVALVRSTAGADLRDKVGQMSKISWRQVSALALAAFFVVGSLSNIFAPPSIYEEYLRWGYPRWFHFVTGSLELTTAVLLARAQTRLWGSALGCTVMLAALATVTLHGEYGHGVAPLVVAALLILVGWIAWRKRLSSTE